MVKESFGISESQEDIINGEVLFALEIAPAQLGEYEGSMPTHCTALQWASISGVSTKDLLEKVREEISDISPISLVVEGQDNFGENNDVPVDLVHKIQELQSLHNKLRGVVEEFGATLRNPEWSGESYAPHITRVDTDSYKIVKGLKITATNLLLVTKMNGTKNIVARVPLGIYK